MGFYTPSKIQETALPALLADPPMDMIAQSQSGTGKTAAFVLAMLTRLDVSQCYPQCLCLAPTYELALQIGQVVKKMSKYINNIQIGYAIRGQPASRQSVKDHIIIETPGTTLDWCRRYKILSLKRLKVFVLDEADVMISIQGFQDQSIRLCSQLSPECQVLLFSATYEDSVMAFAQKIFPNNTVIIRLQRGEECVDNNKQFYVECGSDKDNSFCNIYGSISVGQSMVFCRKRSTASWLAEKLSRDQHAVALLSGELDIVQRSSVIERFRSGKEKVLIMTNVSARGIDVVMVTLVVNFDLPMTVDMEADCETYLHRIGRCGRFGKTGIAINMVDSNHSLSVLKTIEKHFGVRINKLDSDDLDAVTRIDS